MITCTKMLHKPCLKVSPSTFDVNRKENILVNMIMEVYWKQNIERCGIQEKIIIEIQIGWLHPWLARKSRDDESSGLPKMTMFIQGVHNNHNPKV